MEKLLNEMDFLFNHVFKYYKLNDYKEAKEQWRSLIKEAKKLNKSGVMPRVICYCGSLRFKNLFEKYEYESVFKGEIALLPCCMFVDIEREYGALSDYKQKADEQHKRKIDICDEVFVINENGYIGESTRSEIDYALKIGKPIRYMVSEHGA